LVVKSEGSGRGFRNVDGFDFHLKYFAIGSKFLSNGGDDVKKRSRLMSGQSGEIDFENTFCHLGLLFRMKPKNNSLNV
jgi:hypothetical protein